MKTLILNDTHLGVSRQAGTTKQSREALENWMLQQFIACLQIPHDRLITLGDLFDKRNVEEHIMKTVIDLLSKEPDCIIVAGNHDISGIENHTLSSAEFVARLSDSYWLAEAEDIDEEKIYIIPHLHDQDEFDHAVQICPDNAIMMVHANIDSPWAHSAHSLNLSLQQMKDLDARGVKVISGHEHTKRDYHNVTILGNQYPSSISDCLGGDKFAHILEDGVLTSVKTWDDKENYYEGQELPTEHYDFINIPGDCEISEYAKIVKDVAELRKTSDAFIVKNGVKVREFEAKQSGEVVTQFNILDMLLEEIPEELREEVKICL